MDCKEVRELLPLYADGDLQGEDRASVVRHLAGCEGCRERLAQDRRLDTVLSTLREQSLTAHAPAGLRSRVMAEVESERRPTLRGALVLVRAAAALVLALVAGALAYGIFIYAPAYLVPGPAQPTVTDHRPFTVLREQVVSDSYYWPVDGEVIDRTPQLSPDVSKVAYLPTVDGEASDLDRIVVRDLASGTERDLTPEEGYSHSIVRWSPDSGSLAFVKSRSNQTEGATSELWRVDADGSNLRLLYRPLPPASGARGPGFTIARWSSDGRTIDLAPTIWNAGPEGVPIRHINAHGGGEETTLLPTAGWFGVPQDALVGSTVFSPAGDFALQVVKTAPLAERPAGADPDGNSLVLYEVKEQKAGVLASFPGQVRLSPADIAPDGQLISIRAASQAPGAPDEAIDLWVVRRDGTGLRQVVDLPIDRRWGGFVWASGGRAFLNMTPQLWVSRADGQLWEVNAASGTARLVASETWPASVVSASRDGSRLLVGRRVGERGSLHVLELGPLPVVAAPTGVTTPVPVAPTETANTTPLAVGPGAHLLMADERAGWIWNEVRVLRTLDGGATWNDVTPRGQGSPSSLSGRRATFSAAFFLDASTGWVWSTVEDPSSGVLFRTVDGGKTWNGSVVSLALGQFTFVNRMHGWAIVFPGAAAGSHPVEIHRTVDGGATWELLSRSVPGEPDRPGAIPSAGAKTGIRFRDENTGWVVGSVPVDATPYIFVTADGGRTWAEQPLALPEEFRTETFVNAELPVFFNGGEGVLPLRVDAKSHTAMLFYSTQDGGRTWRATTPVRLRQGSLPLWSFADPNYGWLIAGVQDGGNVLLRTPDGGATWEQVASAPELAGTSSLQFESAKVGYAFSAERNTPVFGKTLDGGVSWERVDARASNSEPAAGATEAPPKVINLYARGRVDSISPDAEAFPVLATMAELVLERMDPEVVAALANPAEAVERSKAEGVGIELVYAEAKPVPQTPGPYTSFYIPLAGEPNSPDGLIFLGHGQYSRLVPAYARGEIDTLRQMLGAIPGEALADPNTQSGSGTAPAVPVEPKSTPRP